ncbi:LysE family transporter [Desulfovibrio ferrophilus]|uniref:LysE family transporter n=1 Tax=Desulfovibrio ferrophilus TaxID=241368 RepID=A0A2Z6B182_9BACT|nr:LysE family transporter [Desulfovibrio ferrophilus]BBD09225.1 LysE family transporter [Desulfovibrio ferrophilus]
MMEFLGVTLFFLLGAMAPGADFAVMMKNSMLYSRKSAWLTALGIGASLMVHTTYSLLGLAVVISKSILAFTIIKYLGAAYLCWLGIRSLLEKGGGPEPCSVTREVRDLPMREAFRQGFLCNLLNPKAPLFYIALFSVILTPDTPGGIRLLYGAESVIVVTGWFLFLGTVVTNPRVKAGLSRVQGLLTKALGGMMLYFGIRLALADR